MRQLLILAAAFGIAATAYADDKAPPAPAPDYVEAGPKGRLQFGFSQTKIVNGICYLDIVVKLDGRPIHVMGRLSNQNVGDLFVPNKYSQIPDNADSVGAFVQLGDLENGAVLIEVQNPVWEDKSLLGIFMLTGNHSGIVPSSQKMFLTDGNRLNYWARDIRSAGLTTEGLTFRFEQAQSSDAFFAFLESRRSPRDVNARPTTCGPGDCGDTPSRNTVPGVAIPGHGLVPGAPIAIPYGSRSRDSSLSGYPRY